MFRNILIMKIQIVLLAVLIVAGCNTSRQHESYGTRNFTLGNYTESVSDYEKALSLDQNNKNALLMSGWSYFKLDRYEEALLSFERLLELDSGSTDAMEGVGWTMFKLGRHQESLQTFEMLMEADTHHTGAVEGVAYNYFKLGNIEKAKQYLTIALRENPMSPDNNLIRGYVAQMESDFPVAIEFFNKSLELSGKSDPDTLAAIGNAYLRDKDYNKADYYFNKALDEKPGHKGASAGKLSLLIIKQSIMAAGAELSIAGDYDAAIAEYSEVEKLYPEWVEVYAAKGWAWYKKGDYSEAHGEFNKGLQHYKLSHDIYDGLGWSALKLGRTNQAKDSFKKALGIYPGYYSSTAGLKELAVPAEIKE